MAAKKKTAKKVRSLSVKSVSAKGARRVKGGLRRDDESPKELR